MSLNKEKDLEMNCIARRSLTILIAVIMCFTMTTVTSSAKTSFKSAVKGVSVSSTNPTNLKVSWKAKKGASNYQVYMSDTKAGEYTLVETTKKRSIKVYSNVDGESLDLTHKYYFKVRAYSKKKKKFSKFSAIKSGSPKLSAPTISISIPTNFQAKIKVDPVAEADGYLVYRSTYKDKNFTDLGKVDLDTMLGYKKVPKQNKYYYFKVRAYKTVDGVTYYGNYSSVKKIISKSTLDGNNKKKYAIASGTEFKKELARHNPDQSELAGKRVLCVGSSVVNGAYANGLSFADYLGRFNNCDVQKEALNGTTMAVRESYPGESFVERLEARSLELQEQEWQPDVVLIQLSSNDAGKLDPELFGEVTGEDKISLGDFTVGTTAGAIEYMACYVHNFWPEAKLVFFTMPRREAPRYVALIDILYAAGDKWGFTVVDDLWVDPDVYIAEGTNKYILYMYDRLHPTMAGHMLYIEPVIEKALRELFEGETADPGDPENPGEPSEPTESSGVNEPAQPEFTDVLNGSMDED